MCLPTTVRRSSNGQLMYVYERPMPSKPIPTQRPSEEDPTPPTDDSYTDPFAELSLSSLSSSDETVSSAKTTVQPKAKVPVKQQNSKNNNPTASGDPANDKSKKQTQPSQKKTKTVPLPASHTIDPVQTPSQREPRTRERRVSFPDQLTRGPGRSYSPSSSSDKAVRFAPSLVRGEGSGYSDLSPRASEVFPFTRKAKSPAKQSKSSSQVTPHRATSSSVSQQVATPKSRRVKMGDKEPSSSHDEEVHFDIASDSDDSFTDVIVPAKPVKYVGSHRRNASPRQRYLPAPTTASPRFSSLMVGAFRTGQRGNQSEVGDHESYIDMVTTENTRRNGLSKRRTRTSDIDSHVLDTSTRHSWPQPVFVCKGRTPPAIPSRQSPVFVLRDRSKSKANVDASNKRATGGSTSKHPKWRYQPPSVVDDEIDDGVYWDPVRKMTNRDI